MDLTFLERLAALERRFKRFSVTGTDRVRVAGNLRSGVVVNIDEEQGGVVGGGGPPTPTGACCVAEDCNIQTEPGCIALGGVYLGDGTACDPNPCAHGGCSHISVSASMSASISCATLGAILGASDSFSGEFDGSDPGSISEWHSCLDFGCDQTCEPDTARFGLVAWTGFATCTGISLTAEAGCTDCLSGDCVPSFHYSTDYFVSAGATLPAENGSATDHFSDDVTIFGLACHRIADITVSVRVT